MVGLEASVKFFHTPKVEDDGVNVGWFEDQTYEDGLPVAKVARWNEFGTLVEDQKAYLFRLERQRKAEENDE